jgi:spore germination cell wall hydrolase CwlJ-like protein
MTGLEIGVLCLALNVYYEARSEPPEAQYAVAYVTLNRSRYKRRTLCEEVYSPYQFSWTNSIVAYDEIPKPSDPAWIQAQDIARKSLNTPDITGGALWYHRYDITPWWTWNKKRVAKFGAHVFYKCKKGYRCSWK